MIQLDTHSELDIAIALDVEGKQVYPRFDVLDEHSAMIALDKIRNADQEIMRYEALAQTRIDEITYWLANQTHNLNQKKAHLEAKLENWARSQMTEKTRNIKLPGAVLSVRKMPTEYVRDEKAIIDFLDECDGRGAYIKEKTTRTLDWSSLKKDANVADNGTLLVKVPNIDGELEEYVVPSVQVVEQPDQFQLSFTS